MGLKLDGAHCTVEPHQIVITPRSKTGWEIIISQPVQEIDKQYRVFGLKTPIRNRIPFSNIAVIRAIRTDISIYKGTSLKQKAIQSMGMWHLADQESFVGKERKGFRHDIVVITNQNETIDIASGTTSWDDLEAGNTMSPAIADLHDLLRKMIGKH